jgi:DNA-binding IclR family transcriptional regulator
LYRFTEHTITDRTELDQEFARAREQRFKTDLEESVSDGYSFGVPIFGSAENLGAAISVPLPKMRVPDADHRTELLVALRVTADQIADDLRGR